MGNISNKKTIQNISNKIFNSATRINQEFEIFIQNDKNHDNNHITGGVSSGISSFIDFETVDKTKINIYYDINFAELLRNRYQSLQDLVNNLNNFKKSLSPKPKKNFDDFIFSNEEQKIAFLKRFAPLDGNLTMEEIKDCTRLPSNIEWKKKYEFLVNKLTTLFNKHGFPNPKEIITSIKELQYKKESRCTSGLRTFLRILDKDNQYVIQNSDPSKKFFINFSLKSCKKEHQILRDELEKELENEIKSSILLPTYFIFEEGMTVGNEIKVKYGFIEGKNKIINEFEWKIPDNFLDTYKYGDKIILSDNDIPFKIRLTLLEKWQNIYYDEKRKLPSPPVLKKNYYLSFNLNEKDKFNQFIKNSIDEFIKLQKKHNYGYYL